MISLGAGVTISSPSGVELIQKERNYNTSAKLPPWPASNDPNDPGSIGDWICCGTLTGAQNPFAFIPPYHLLANGGRLVSDCPATAPEARAAVFGGLGSFSGASGDLSAVELGVNSTGCPNIRFTIRLK